MGRACNTQWGKRNNILVWWKRQKGIKHYKYLGVSTILKYFLDKMERYGMD
jgi:hypothetical protein